ncbi:unnamed protein product [marine sediment metagenome]|uniref:Uncharacterized protein n=1 Tax=marine sediment metagenome TaxID=412755 RepID=X1BAC7_9ZZZZ
MNEKYEKIITITICFFVIVLTFKMLLTPDSTDDQDILESGSIQFGTDINYNTGWVKSIVSFLRMIYDPIDVNDTVTIEKSNNNIYVNHTSPENWSRIVGLEYEKYTSPGYTTSNSSEWLNNSSELFLYRDDIAIVSNNPIYESMFCGRQWVIEREGDVWHVNRFIDGNFSYCPLVINMELLLG